MIHFGSSTTATVAGFIRFLSHGCDLRAQDLGLRKDSPMSTCIQIIECVVPVINRLALKGHMEQFGQVDLVHMGDRQNPEEEPPKVRRGIACCSAKKTLGGFQKGPKFRTIPNLVADCRFAFQPLKLLRGRCCHSGGETPLKHAGNCRNSRK